MMINRDEIIAEVTNSIAARLKVELEAPLKELLFGLKASRELLAAQLRDLADDVSKLKSTEDLLEPSIESIPKFDTDLEVIPVKSKSWSNFALPSLILSADKENFRSTARTQFPDRDEAGFEVGVQEYNDGSSFLAYQEGKPFILGNDFVVDFQIKRDESHELNDFNTLNQNNNRIENSSGLNFLKKQSCVEGLDCCLDSARILFDRDKEIKSVVSCSSCDRNKCKFCMTSYWFVCNGLIIMDEHNENSSYELTLELADGLELLLVKSNVFFFV
ncbi:uncharacterized protein LOC113350283 [Papaver somniferum]|uniref:uncharacterized protein LOC113350283 n=1 Tax=Papaver somniferum TaxID=3469 RepID=UPI000E703518|nr:uncharacterized protein LOC113350283 [Papaver somniferum]XP_026450187.1 uncharacterized protein LOC113350283 [Papaver somniferum]